MIQVYNTMEGHKVDFVPRDAGKVAMYVCGPTVYNYIHLGNARPIVVFDTIRRYLKYAGYAVTYVQNFTDVDDKIINRAIEEKSSAAAVAEKYIAAYFEDVQELNVLPADVRVLRGERRRLFCGGELCGLRQTFRPGFGGYAGRGPGAGGRAKAQPDGFCLVESGKTGRTKLGKPLGAGPAGLAY